MRLCYFQQTVCRKLKFNETKEAVPMFARISNFCCSHASFLSLCCSVFAGSVAQNPVMAELVFKEVQAYVPTAQLVFTKVTLSWFLFVI